MPGSVQSPNARFIQWKAELRGASILDDVTLAYIPQNMPPCVKSINVFTVAAPAASYSKSSSQSRLPQLTRYVRVQGCHAGRLPARRPRSAVPRRGAEITSPGRRDYPVWGQAGRIGIGRRRRGHGEYVDALHEPAAYSWNVRQCHIVQN